MLCCACELSAKTSNRNTSKRYTRERVSTTTTTLLILLLLLYYYLRCAQGAVFDPSNAPIIIHMRSRTARKTLGGSRAAFPRDPRRPRTAREERNGSVSSVPLGIALNVPLARADSRKREREPPSRPPNRQHSEQPPPPGTAPTPKPRAGEFYSSFQASSLLYRYEQKWTQ